MADAMDASGTLPGKRKSTMGYSMGSSDESSVTQKRRCRASDPHLVFVADQEIAKEREQLWGPDMEARWGATHASPVEGADAAISARTA